MTRPVWLQYAAFEEIDTKDYDRARDVYKAAVKLVPHRSFSFAKLWLAYAYFEIRRGDVNSARKVLGAGIGMSPKPKLFTGYIELEMRLREFDRVRTLYQKFLTVCHGPIHVFVKKMLTKVVRRIAELGMDTVDTSRERGRGLCSCSSHL